MPSATTASSSRKSGASVHPASGAGARGKEFLRFLLAGALNTALTYAIYLLATLVVGYQVAYAIAFLAGIVISYWLGLRYVFRQAGSLKKVTRYPLVYLVQYAAGAIMLELLVRHVGVSVQLAPLVIVVLTLPLTFILSKFVLAGDKRGQS